MPWQQRVTEGVTVTWAGEAPPRPRRPHRRSAPVNVRVEPVRQVRPSTEDLARIGDARGRERLAALLSAEGVLPGGGDSVATLELRPLASSLVAQGVGADTLVLALLELGHDEVASVRAVWWGPFEQRRGVVLALLQHEGWSGAQLHDVLSEVGLDAAERAAVVDPLGR